ncbi:MAG: hypothetical protein BKP49_06060 [Treponema sp. CETP13]|nr:MAG: hypothetical protein BKP49_06060 [Treponema sp. CETP13]
MKKTSLFFLLFLIVFPYFLIANPIYTPKNAKTITDPSTGEVISTGAPEVLPVRIAGGNPDLIKKQGVLREKIADVFVKIKNAEKVDSKSVSKSSYLHLLWLVLSLSFAYGILHASGPGHRKTIVFSLYLTRSSPWWEPLMVSLFLALLHGCSAIIIMLIFKGVAGSIGYNTDNVTMYMEGFTYLLLIITTIWLIIHESREYLTQQKKFATQSEDKHKSTPTDKLQKYGLIPFLISGIYPCPGAILILVLSFSLHLLRLGAFSVIAMSLGMSIPIMIAGYLAWSGRSGLFHTLKANQTTAAKVAYSIQMFGFSILLIFSLYISWPFLYSLFT